MIVLGIESSCDETGVGIISLNEDGDMEILANTVASSMQQHARFGGVVPEIASRAHLEAMPQVMQAALQEAGIDKPDVVACHAGLECGILGTNYPDMDMISFGPTIKGAHSPDERASIKSSQKFWKYLLEILENIPVKN